MPIEKTDSPVYIIPGKLLTVKELCEILNVKRSYIYMLTSQKQIPFIKINGLLRFQQDDIGKWLMEQRQDVEIGQSQGNQEEEQKVRSLLDRLSVERSEIQKDNRKHKSRRRTHSKTG